MSPPFAVVGYGLCMPLGLDAQVAAAEMVAGTTAFAETEVTGRSGEPVRAARLPLIPEAASRAERIVLLARTALVDLLSRTPRELRNAGMPVVLALPSTSDGGATLDVRAVAAMVVEAAREGLAAEAQLPTWRTSNEIPRAPIVVAGGRAALFAALEEAETLLADRGTDCVLVGAADSLSDPQSLETLARANRILDGTNPDGLIPGEGAGFLIVRRGGPSPYGHLIAHARARGAAADAAPESAGEALTKIFMSLGAASAARATHVFSSQPSDRRWGRELSIAMLRAPRVLPEPFAITRITESAGDPNVAGAMILTVAALATSVGRPDGPVLVYGMSDDGLAGGLLVERH
jgi:3-oxoacyl-[acyl-carrier-protein] synthase-1